MVTGNLMFSRWFCLFFSFFHFSETGQRAKAKIRVTTLTGKELMWYFRLRGDFETETFCYIYNRQLEKLAAVDQESSSRTYGAERPHVWPCPKFLVVCSLLFLLQLRQKVRTPAPWVAPVACVALVGGRKVVLRLAPFLWRSHVNNKATIIRNPAVAKIVDRTGCQCPSKLSIPRSMIFMSFENSYVTSYQWSVAT